MVNLTNIEFAALCAAFIIFAICSVILGIICADYYRDRNYYKELYDELLHHDSDVSSKLSMLDYKCTKKIEVLQEELSKSKAKECYYKGILGIDFEGDVEDVNADDGD